MKPTAKWSEHESHRCLIDFYGSYLAIYKYSLLEKIKDTRQNVNFSLTLPEFQAIYQCLKRYTWKPIETLNTVCVCVLGSWVSGVWLSRYKFAAIRFIYQISSFHVDHLSWILEVWSLIYYSWSGKRNIYMFTALCL